jgi:hypothetical protein
MPSVSRGLGYEGCDCSASTRGDAEQMLLDAGIKGHSERIQRYLEQKFGCHPLVVGVVGGLVRNHMRAPGNFDRWVEASDGGGAVNLADSDIIQRRTHILKQAFDGLEPLARELVARIAVISSAAWDVLEVLNPARPQPPDEVEEPSAPDLDDDREIHDLRQELARAEAQVRGYIQHRISNRQRDLQERFRNKQQAYRAYQSAVAAWRESDAAAPRWLNAALRDLETRGLLQCDRGEEGNVDLHPMVRGYAVGSLSAEAREQAGQRVADYFSSRPEPSYEGATSLADLADAVQVVRALNLGGKTQAAWGVLRGDLRKALYRLECHHERIALMQPLFPNGWSAPPDGVAQLDFVAIVAALALKRIGLLREANVQEIFSIEEDIRAGLSGNLAISLRNNSITVRLVGELARSERILELARIVAAAASDARHTLRSELDIVGDLVLRGRLAKARALYADIATRLPDEARYDLQLDAQSLCRETYLLHREGALTYEKLYAAIARVRARGQRGYERRLVRLSGDWHQANGRDVAAVKQRKRYYDGSCRRPSRHLY